VGDRHLKIYESRDNLDINAQVQKQPHG